MDSLSPAGPLVQGPSLGSRHLDRPDRQERTALLRDRPGRHSVVNPSRAGGTRGVHGGDPADFPHLRLAGEQVSLRCGLGGRAEDYRTNLDECEVSGRDIKGAREGDTLSGNGGGERLVQSSLVKPSCVKWSSWVRISVMPCCRMTCIEVQSAKL